MRRSLPVLAMVLAVSCGARFAAASTPAEVDPRIGSAAPDNAFVGAQVPFGFASPGPDTLRPSTAGYSPGQPIVGFSMTHVSGTGGGSKYGNFRVTPGIRGRASAQFTAAEEQAAAGSYSVVLRPLGIRAQLTAARLAAIERYTFPATRSATLTLDAASTIDHRGSIASGAWVRRTGRSSFEGGGVFRGGWGGGSHRMYFAAQLDRAARLSVSPSRRRLTATFDTRRARTIRLRIGISFTSPAMAARHLGELPGFTFRTAQRRAQAQWGAVLGKIQVRGGTADDRRQFATALYHAHLMPHDVSGDGGWPGGPHYEDFFTLWDTFRTTNPLITLIEPERTSAMLTSLVTTYRLTGWLPDARIATQNGYTQVGSDGDIVVADALLKGVGGVDYRTAYRALLKDGDVDSPAPDVAGRTLSDWHKLHYVSLAQPRSGARTLEYAYDDFAIAEVAQRLGHPGQAARYLARSGYWANLWDPVTRSLRPRNRAGAFLDPFFPDRRGVAAAPFYEGSPLGYSTFVPHDVQGLINALGGDDAFVGWLNDVMACCYNPGNEPDLLAPWLYIHAGRPDLTDAAVRNLLATAYHTATNGLPGNDDSGTLSAWYTWSAIGLFPNAGQPYYYIGAPIFRNVRIAVGRGRTFTIEAPRASAAARYVVRAWLNGHELQRAFLTHQEVARGGTLRLVMASAPSGWGTAQRPPSVSKPSGS